MEEKILLVDDDASLITSFQRSLGEYFQIEGALSGDEGLEKIANSGPYAVIVSDMRMPGMDGIRFLIRAKQLAPNSIRMMLTGHADLQLAINVVNEGYIFRFLTKPIDHVDFRAALEAGLKQYRLMRVEQELLEKTLVGSIKMLIKILSSVNPAAIGKAARLRKIVVHLVNELGLENPWQYELAAMLSQIGLVTYPTAFLDKLAARKPLFPNEQEMFAKHPLIGKRLLESIPRLELIAGMVEGQLKSLRELNIHGKSGDDYAVAIGAHILHLALDYDDLTMQGLLHRDIITALTEREKEYDSKVLAALLKMKVEEIEEDDIEIKYLDDLTAGMTIAEEIRDPDGNILINKGQELSHDGLVQLFKFAQRGGFVKQHYKVYPKKRQQEVVVGGIDAVYLDDLQVGMIAMEDVRGLQDKVIARRGAELTHEVIMELFKLARQEGFVRRAYKVKRLVV